jgi:hypothetical protein
MLPIILPAGGHGLDESELLGEPLGRRAARQGTKLAGQVRLVVVAALGRQAGEPHAPGIRRTRGGRRGPGDPVPRVVEPDHPGRLLRGKPHLSTEQRVEVTRAPPGLGGQLRHGHRAMRDPQPPPGVRYLRPDPVAAPRAGPGYAPSEQRVDHREPPIPGPLRRDLFPQFRRERPEYFGRRHVEVRQLCGGHAEQPACAERRERELDSGLPAVVGDQRGGGVQAAEQRVVRSGRLPRIWMNVDEERVVQRHDERQPSRRQPAMPPGRDACLPVPGVPRDERPQPRRRHPPYVLIDHTSISSSSAKSKPRWLRQRPPPYSFQVGFPAQFEQAEHGHRAIVNTCGPGDDRLTDAASRTAW